MGGAVVCVYNCQASGAGPAETADHLVPTDVTTDIRWFPSRSNSRNTIPPKHIREEQWGIQEIQRWVAF